MFVSTTDVYGGVVVLHTQQHIALSLDGSHYCSDVVGASRVQLL